jgi:hypothetical protein
MIDTNFSPIMFSYKNLKLFGFFLLSFKWMSVEGEEVGWDGGADGNHRCKSRTFAFPLVHDVLLSRRAENGEVV